MNSLQKAKYNLANLSTSSKQNTLPMIKVTGSIDSELVTQMAR